MGKKSRLKRERRASRMWIPPLGSTRQSSAALDAKFQEQTDSLRRFFAKFNPVDVIVSLGVSELWLPNRSSQVKHVFALQVALSMRASEFTTTSRIETYDEFQAFTGDLQRLLPVFAMLEDFVPEPDWGEVHLPADEKIEPIFFGCSVERIPDFIDAFRLVKADTPQALADMRLALAMQAHVIRSVPASLVGSAESVDAGHIETPTAEFWTVCREALLSTTAAVQPFSHGVSDALTVDLGSRRSSRTWEDFGDAVMTGMALPHIIVRIGTASLPVSLRSTSTAVVDLWTRQPSPKSIEELIALDRRVGGFLAGRLRQGTVVAGPINVVGRAHAFDGHFAAVVSSRKKFYFIVLITLEELPGLGGFERNLKRLIDQSDRWGLALPDIEQVVEFRRDDGLQPRSADIQIVAVLSKVTTQATSLPLPATDARVLGLPDFISIFDSLKDADELDEYWTYIDGIESVIGGLSGPVDLFASFRDSHALLIEGAMTPDFISLDPHWNSNWRFKELKEFWARAPRLFPDGQPTWIVDEKSNGLTTLRAKGPLVLAWSGSAGATTFQALMEVDSDKPDMENGPLLELFIHCVVDAITQRASLLAPLELFRRDHIVIHCLFNEQALASLSDRVANQERASRPLLSNWRVESIDGTKKVVAVVAVNLARLHQGLEQAKDASFEAECVTETVNGLCALLRLRVDEVILALLQEIAKRQPRFTTQTTRRQVDVPDYANPKIPQSEHYKLARRDLAVVLKKQGVAAPARYELEPAKLIINAARDAARQEIHAQVSRLDRNKLLLFCIEQHDKLTAKYESDVTRAKLSLRHEVSFDRGALLADAHKKFITLARNYRYLLECCLSSPGRGDALFESSAVVQLVAAVDWLSVLYGASDTLHNDIDVGGIELNDSFVPTVYFSEDRELKERQFLQEAASAKLGIGLQEEDEVNSSQEDTGNWQPIDDALAADVGFSLTHLVQSLHVLSHWHSAGGSPALQFSYTATPQAIADMLLARVPNLASAPAHKIVDFLTLDSAGVRRLAGKDEDEPDVPVWEHYKRVHRYLIRPLVRIDGAALAWGAATVHRAAAIWTGSIVNGYLPADFPWPNMVKTVRTVKVGIEQQLEVRAFEVSSRVAPCVMRGIDFRRRFPKENFDDVGDFDVLAYWPERNVWLSIECKYNQPPYCLKDARRLRERIFGNGDGRGQIEKIERRRGFLAENVERVRQLLEWPEGRDGAPKFWEAYVCRDIYWWLRHSPYAVPTEFVRIDALEAWLRAAIDAEQEPDQREPQAEAGPAQIA
jgi:hypothetical protein